ncbi:hypothetical protein GGX14DRAFT_392000 [Mycena pura]|uniref:Uncharacterized protein n=1 Tax=Mycena pura TaxID=153505 RepID=A0AAD6VPD7_9AGAR|nr:hypothetical protein GGX14DRAFT_392000 [Mycena pura]
MSGTTVTTASLAHRRKMTEWDLRDGQIGAIVQPRSLIHTKNRSVLHITGMPEWDTITMPSPSPGWTTPETSNLGVYQSGVNGGAGLDDELSAALDRMMNLDEPQIGNDMIEAGEVMLFNRFSDEEDDDEMANEW